eukprot:CAMPEP_0115002220 /NCGR_PEP_ID=MMETSP0216-20121206/17872_1 /TAXON_ID=223996 /ORGANISM="Protocruzia adherens, Strain Boccale" /LENGTH=99 /DNA_ID=CAMNT_0002367765 /DNA_START=58 /DNA_END=357 /DNA_ORIENTATION=-
MNAYICKLDEEEEEDLNISLKCLLLTRAMAVDDDHGQMKRATQTRAKGEKGRKLASEGKKVASLKKSSEESVDGDTGMIGIDYDCSGFHKTTSLIISLK